MTEQANPITPQQPETIVATKKQFNWKNIIIGVVLLAILVGVALFFLFYQGLLPSLLKTQPDISSKKVTSISTAHNVFGFNILKQLNNDDKTGNIFMSPSSIALALSMTYNGAGGETKNAMAETLKLTNFSIDEVNNSSSNLLSLLENSDPKVQINIANSIWARNGVEFNQNFIDVNKKCYQAKVTTLDFQQKGAVDVINKWVSDSTEGKIPTIIEPPISYDTVMYLINAIYFKGTWTYEFNKKLTEDREFTSSDGSKSQKPMMQQTRKDFSYLETNDFQAVELPYGEKKSLEMYVFLPKKDLPKLSEKLTSSNWSSWLSKFKEEEGTLLLPKFKIEYEVELKDVLKKLGMGVAFEDSADFGKIAKGAFISEVLHKSYVDVNEEGTEAAAATSVDVTLGFTPHGPEKKVFYMEVNKPFFFAIADKETKEILFMGLVKNIP